MRISEKQLRGIIRESISNLLLEWDPNEPDEDYGYDRPKVSSYAIFYFNPETFEIVATRENWNDKYYQEHPELGYCAISSADFPDAWSTYNPGNYWTPPESDGDVGACGGDFDVDDFSMPEEYGDENIDEWEAKFIEVNREEILETLSEYASFD
jgi:hypothetical protein